MSSFTSTPTLRVQLNSASAIAPTRATPGSAGYDLYASGGCVIPAHGKGMVPTGISVGIPEGYYGRIAPRSSLAWKSHIDVAAGVIDRDYTGNVGIALFNHSGEAFMVSAGDRVAQLILTAITTPEVEIVDTLESTARGDGGFGSTGK